MVENYLSSIAYDILNSREDQGLQNPTPKETKILKACEDYLNSEPDFFPTYLDHILQFHDELSEIKKPIQDILIESNFFLMFSKSLIFLMEFPETTNTAIEIIYQFSQLSPEVSLILVKNGAGTYLRHFLFSNNKEIQLTILDIFHNFSIDGPECCYFVYCAIFSDLCQLIKMNKMVSESIHIIYQLCDNPECVDDYHSLIQILILFFQSDTSIPRKKSWKHWAHILRFIARNYQNCCTGRTEIENLFCQPEFLKSIFLKLQKASHFPKFIIRILQVFLIIIYNDKILDIILSIFTDDFQSIPLIFSTLNPILFDPNSLSENQAFILNIYGIILRKTYNLKLFSLLSDNIFLNFVSTFMDTGDLKQQVGATDYFTSLIQCAIKLEISEFFERDELFSILYSMIGILQCDTLSTIKSILFTIIMLFDYQTPDGKNYHEKIFKLFEDMTILYDLYETANDKNDDNESYSIADMTHILIQKLESQNHL